MNISMQLAVVIAAVACLCVVAGAPEGRLTRAKQQRPTRGFKNLEMMTARGFGKRDSRPHTRTENQIGHVRRKFNPKNSLMVAYDFGKRSGNDENSDEVYNLDNVWEMLENGTEREGQDGTDDKTMESIPVDWFVTELLNNPEFARSLVRKFIDLDQDGMLSADELLRNVV